MAKDTDFARADAALKQLSYLKDLAAAINASKGALEPLMAQAVDKDQVLIDMQTQLGDHLWVMRVVHLEKQRNQERDRMDGLADE